MTDSNQLVSPGAQELWTKSLAPDDRVLVTGASGWFGQTAAYLLRNCTQPSLLLASSDREITGAGGKYDVYQWNEKLIREFSPSIVIDCAFLTRDLVSSEGLKEYVATNQDLTSHLLDLASASTVKRVITISSGAAVYPVDALTQSLEENPYGYLKRQAEIQLENLSRESGVSAVVARAWAVSGAFIGKPHNYALADMIIQARRGHIAISADRRVSRRYTSVEDLLAISLASSQSEGFSTVDSEGPLVEMGELAHRVVEVINPEATITRPQLSNKPENDYWSSSEEWASLCAHYGLTPSDLDDQIRRTANGLKKMGLA